MSIGKPLKSPVPTNPEAHSSSMTTLALAQKQIIELGLEAITADLETILERATALTSSALRVEHGHLLEIKQGALSINRQPSPDQLPEPVLSLLGQVLKHNQPSQVDWTPDLRQTLSDNLRAYGVQSSLGVPVRLPDRAIGWWCVHSVKPRTFTPEEIAFAQTIATIIASALERHKISELLRERELQLESILNSLQDVVWASDASGAHTLFMSAAAEHLYGRPVEDFYADSDLWLNIVHPDDRERVRVINNQLAILGSFDLEYRILRPNGEVRWLHDRAQAIRNPQGLLIRIDGIASDITERKRAALEVERRKRQYRTLVSNLPDELVMLFDEHLQINLAGGTLLARLDLASDEVEDRAFAQVQSPLFQKLIPLAARALEGEAQFEEMAQRELHLSVQVIPIFNGDGESQGGMVLAKDISHERRSRQLESRHQREIIEIFESITDAFITVDFGGRITRVNARAADLIGQNRERILGEQLSSLCPPLLPPDWTAGRAMQPTSFEGRLPDSERWFSARIYPSESGFGLYVIDITERRRNEQAITQLNAQLEQNLKRLNALHEIDRALGASHDLQLTLGIIVERALQHLQADTVTILRYNPAMARLEHAASQGFLHLKVRSNTVPMGAWLAGRVALQQTPLSIVQMRETLEGTDTHQLLDVEGFVSYNAVPLLSKGKLLGVLEVFHRHAFEPDQEWLDFLHTLGIQAGIAVENAQLVHELQLTNTQLTLAVDQIIEASARAMDFHEGRPDGHAQRAMELTVRVARAFGLNDLEVSQVRRGALLHDVGMLGVPDQVRFKADSLEPSDWAIVENHPNFAYELLRGVRFLRPALQIPCSHHERWDALGYPKGLQGESIPLEARIFAVVDAFEAMRCDRTDRRALSLESTVQEIRNGAGSKYDPQVVAVFLDILEQECAP
jgi:PAS domain S-box-containing protein